MAGLNKEIEQLELQIKFLEIEIQKTNTVNIDLQKQLALCGVGCSLPNEKEITIEAEKRFPYKKHFVDYNNGMHEGFIDGADFVLQAIRKTKKLKKQLILNGVSHRRELLIDAISNMTRGDFELRSTCEYVDEYLDSINCG